MVVYPLVYLMVMTTLALKANTTVSAWVGSSLVEVDVDLGVTESAASAIAYSNALRDKVNRFLFDELDGCHGVRLL